MADLDSAWRQWFEALRAQHALVTAVDLGPVGDGSRRYRALGRSLATFQLGETGDGAHLLHAAIESGASEDHLGALRFFVAEEQEHARLLALVLYGLGVPLRTRHWTDRVFVTLRRARSLRTAVLTLLVAEVVALSYYGALKDGLPSESLRDLFGRVHADEVRHVAFHCDTLPRHLQLCHPAARHGGRLLWNALVAATSAVVALDHGGALRCAGVTRRRFISTVHRDRQATDRRLFGASSQPPNR